MTNEDRGVLLFDTKHPKVTGYLVIGNEQYWIVGHRISDIRTNLTIKKVEAEQSTQSDLFDDRSQQAGDRKQNIL